MGSSGLLDELLKSGNFLISLHTISSTSFDFIFIVKIEKPEFQEQFIRINDHFAKHGNFNFDERNYHGQVINEIQDATSKESFSYILSENHFIGSFTPFLIEDVIRTVQGVSENFKTNNGEAFDLTYLEFDVGNIYLDLDKLSSFMSLFVDDRQSPLIRYMNSFNGSGFLDMDFEQNYIYANGFFIPENDSSYLSVFRNLKPASSNYYQFIPENAALVFYQSFDNAVRWHKGVREFWRKSRWTQSDSLTKFINTFDFDLDRTLNWMNSHLIQIYLEPTNNHSSRLSFHKILPLLSTRYK